MSFRILFVTATSSEAAALKRINGIDLTPNGFRFGNLELSLLITGVGSMATAWAINNWLGLNRKPDLAVNAGIAGSFNEKYLIGDVVMPNRDCFADSGIEDGEDFLTLSEAGMAGPDEFLFENGQLVAASEYTDMFKHIVPVVSAITVNTTTGSEVTKNKLVNKFNPDVETMEGATFFYICKRGKIPFFALRAISNKIELRNRDNWNISLALENLSLKLNEIFITLDTKK